LTESAAALSKQWAKALDWDQISMAAEIARVVLDRPTKANALTAKGMRDLAQRIEEAGARANTGIVVIEGRGDKGFCAGADIVEFASGPDALRDQGAGLVGIAKAISGSKSPVLSLIYGRTLGAGGMIAALSDIVVAADSLVFGFPDIVFSMYPAMMHSALLSRVSASLAWQLCASGRLLNAPQALDLGIVTEVLPADQFAQAAEE